MVLGPHLANELSGAWQEESLTLWGFSHKLVWAWDEGSDRHDWGLAGSECLGYRVWEFIRVLRSPRSCCCLPMSFIRHKAKLWSKTGKCQVISKRQSESRIKKTENQEPALVEKPGDNNKGLVRSGRNTLSITLQLVSVLWVCFYRVQWRMCTGECNQ